MKAELGILLHVVIASVLAGLIGIAVALDQYYLAVGATLFILFINYLMGKITSSLKRRKSGGQEG